MAFAPDGRLFVAQQGGALRVIKNGALLTTPFLSLTTDQNGERGLLGVAFDPGFTSNQFIYLYYTVPGSPAHNRVNRFTANGDAALAGSQTIVMELENLSTATNHNGGALHFGSATSNPATLTVVSNAAPTGTITSPVVGSLYSSGDTIVFGGAATDPEDGTLPASQYTWKVEFHHYTHTHPVMGPISGQTTGSSPIPRIGETSTNVFYRITLTVTDSGGLQHVSWRDVLPRTVNVALATSVNGLMLTLDGQPVSARFTFAAVVGMDRIIGAPSPQTLFNNKTYVFTSWSDGGAQIHTIRIPAASSTYTANFTRIKR